MEDDVDEWFMIVFFRFSISDSGFVSICLVLTLLQVDRDSITTGHGSL